MPKSTIRVWDVKNRTEFYTNLSNKVIPTLFTLNAKMTFRWMKIQQHSFSYLSKTVFLVTLVTGPQSLFVVFVVVLGLQVSNSSVTSLFPLLFSTFFGPSYVFSSLWATSCAFPWAIRYLPRVKHKHMIATCYFSKREREREKTNKMQQSDVYCQHCLKMFRASLCPSSGEQKTVCYCMWCAALVLLDVVGSGCGALRCRVRAVWRLLLGASTVKVNVWCENCEGYCLVRALWRLLFAASSVKVTVWCEHCEGYCLVRAVWRLLFGASSVKVTVWCEHCEGYCLVRALWKLLARTPQRSAPQPLPTTSSRTSAAHHVQ